MHKSSISRLIFLAVALWPGVRAVAWEDHVIITREALREQAASWPPGEYRPLNESLAGGLAHFRATDTASLLQELKIHKAYNFPPKLQEARGKKFSALEIVAVYADEPDWGCDQNLFGPDQYPELWTQDTPYIAYREGGGSQGFRHMYFPGKFLWSEPISSFQIPSHPIGKAPARAVLFQQLAKALYNQKQYYWAYRFFGWSLHFIEDLTQPFHVRQILDRHFLRFKWKGWRPDIDVALSADQVAYYHRAYERWVSHHLVNAPDTLLPALKTDAAAPLVEGDPEAYVKTHVVEPTSRLAARLGRDSYRAFPPYDSAREIPVEVFVVSEEWRSQVHAANAATFSLPETTAQLFAHQSAVIRAWARFFKPRD